MICSDLLEASEECLNFLCTTSGRAFTVRQDCGCRKMSPMFLAGEIMVFYTTDVVVLKNYYRPCSPDAIPYGNDHTMSIPLEALYDLLQDSAFYAFCELFLCLYFFVGCKCIFLFLYRQ